MPKSFSFLFLFLFLFPLWMQAATVTWNGSVGFWHQANRWDTGQVPGPDDDVIIPGGFAIVATNTQAFAKTVTVQSGSFFGVDFNGELRLADQLDVVAFTNHGSVLVVGTIFLDNIQGSDPLEVYRGIVNHGLFQILNSGEIQVNQVDNDVIYNELGALFLNAGSIQMNLATTAWIKGIYNRGRFDNQTTGVIRIKGSFYGIQNSPQSTYFYNRGKIVVAASEAAGISNRTLLRNFPTGSIALDRSGISNQSGDLINEGTIYLGRFQSLSLTAFALTNQSFLQNTGIITIMSSETGGLNNRTSTSGGSPIFENDGTLVVRASNLASMRNDYSFINTPNGRVEVDNTLEGTGLYLNNGILISATTSFHNPVLDNNGIVEDRHGRLQGNTNNMKVIVRPIPGPLFASQGIMPAFGVGSLSGVNVGDWVDDLGGDICGGFLPSMNLLVVNANAESDDDGFLWVHLTLTSSGQSDWFRVKVTNNVPLQVGQAGRAPLFPASKESIDQQDQAFAVELFPNPTAGAFRIRMFTQTDQTYTASILDSHGRTLWTDHQRGYQQTLEFTPSLKLPAGTYWVRVRGEDGEYAVQQLMITL